MFRNTPTVGHCFLEMHAEQESSVNKAEHVQSQLTFSLLQGYGGRPGKSTVQQGYLNPIPHCLREPPSTMLSRLRLDS